ncbi:MAG: winged helix-turn-helix transcriptional regulator [Sphingosinicella sp.]|uniref:winged helix-turn-helix transcriptional regulator n=1 Tax=Sphingosinicella sp. TaxID=1917971 RepID=UPI0040383217
MLDVVVGLHDVQDLSAGRWLIPILALLERRQGARFAELLGLGPSRSMLKRSLRLLIEQELVRPNPGHGHPLRPEYLLTDEGAKLGRWCARVTAAREQLGLGAASLGRWALPILFALASGERRFSTLEAELTPVSPRALSLALKQLLALGLIDRRLADEFPPAAIYSLTARGQRLAEAMR